MAEFVSRKKLVRKLDLEITLSKIKPHPSPKAYLEQYTIDPKAVANILHMAAYTYTDIMGKTVADLGCGTGRLAIGAVLLGAKVAIGVDIDRTAIEVASTYSKMFRVHDRTQWVTGDLAAIRGKFDTILQNPPFGIQQRKADQVFIKKALEIGKRVYSLHKHVTSKVIVEKALRKKGDRILPGAPSPFLKRFIQNQGGEIIAVYTFLMTIPRMFRFHRREKHEFPVDLYVIENES